MSDKLTAERLRPVLCTAMRFLDYAAGEGIVLNTGGEELDAGDIMSELADACDVADHDADIVEPICAAILAMAEERERDHAEINLKAAFIEKTLNDMAAMEEQMERMREALFQIDNLDGVEIAKSPSFVKELAREGLGRALGKDQTNG